MKIEAGAFGGQCGAAAAVLMDERSVGARGTAALQKRPSLLPTAKRRSGRALYRPGPEAWPLFHRPSYVSPLGKRFFPVGSWEASLSKLPRINKERRSPTQRSAGSPTNGPARA